MLQLCELELIERERRAAERRLKAAKFPNTKTLESFDFTAQPSINKQLVTELMRGAYLDQRESIILIGNAGTGKTHLATALGVQACGQGRKVRFWRVTELITHLIEAREERQLPAIPGEVFLSGGCVGRQLLGQEVAQVRSGRIFRGATSRASCSRKLDISLLNRLPSLLSSTLAQTLSRTW